MNHLRRESGMFVALAAICGVLAVSNASFYGAENVANTVRQIAMLARSPSAWRSSSSPAGSTCPSARSSA